MFATHHPRSTASPPHLCVRRLPRPGRGELCVKIPPSFNSYFRTSSEISEKPRQNNFFKINALRTLPSSVASKSFPCHSYENCRVYTNNSHFGTHLVPATSPITCPLPLPVPSEAEGFPFFSYSCALFCTHQNHNPFIFMRFRTLCTKTRGGVSSPNISPARLFQLQSPGSAWRAANPQALWAREQQERKVGSEVRE